MKRLWIILKTLNAPCRELSRWATEADDHAELDIWQKLAYRIHLTFCVPCRRYRNQVRKLRAALRAWQRRLVEGTAAMAGPRLDEEAKARIRARLEQR